MGAQQRLHPKIWQLLGEPEPPQREELPDRLPRLEVQAYPAQRWALERQMPSEFRPRLFKRHRPEDVPEKPRQEQREQVPKDPEQIQPRISETMDPGERREQPIAQSSITLMIISLFLIVIFWRVNAEATGASRVS